MFDKLVAYATMGKYYHVEAVFSIRCKNTNTVVMEPKTFSAFMNRKFNAYPIYTGYFKHNQWDFLFVPLTEDEIDQSLNWLDTEIGCDYDFFHAFSCPFVCMHNKSTKDDDKYTHYKPNDIRIASKTTKQNLFCSEACLYILQPSTRLQHIVQNVIPERCSPSALYTLLQNVTIPVSENDCIISTKTFFGNHIFV